MTGTGFLSKVFDQDRRQEVRRPTDRLANSTRGLVRRHLAPITLIGFCWLAVPPAAGAWGTFQEPFDSPTELSDFLTPKELEKYREKPKYKDRIDLIRDAVRRYGKEITVEVRLQALTDLEASLAQLQSLAVFGQQEAGRPASAKDRRSSQVRKLEIELRKTVETLDDLKNSVPYETRLKFDSAANELEILRSRLLGQIFGSTEPRGPAETSQPLSVSFPLFSAGAIVQHRGGSGMTGDQFTDTEYEKIQDAQKLDLRVEVFLQIAQARIDEIQRRQENREWDKEDPNPLEFYTVAQMLRAYHRSIQGIMINIDEKARYKTASKKEIEKSLKKLNEKIALFIPVLPPLLDSAREDKDEELFLEARQAIKVSDQALKGSQLGLGAPQETKRPPSERQTGTSRDLTQSRDMSLYAAD